MAKSVRKRVCDWCGEEFLTTNTNRKYCCKKCGAHHGSGVAPEYLIREAKAKKAAKLASLEARDRKIESSGHVAKVTFRDDVNERGQRVTIETRGRC